MFDRSAELANITRPVVGQERVHRVGRKIDKGLVIFLAEVAQESANQNRDISFRSRNGGMVMRTTLRRK